MDPESSSLLIVLGAQQAWSESCGILPMVGFDTAFEQINEFLDSCYSGYYSNYYGHVAFVNFFDKDLVPVGTEEFGFCEGIQDVVAELFDNDEASSWSAPMLNPQFTTDVVCEDFEEYLSFDDWCGCSHFVDATICGLNVDLYAKQLGAVLMGVQINPIILNNLVTWTDTANFVDVLSYYGQYGEVERV